MIVVTVVNRKFLNVFLGKFTQAAAAYPGIKFERPPPIALIAGLASATSIGDDSVKFVFVDATFHVGRFIEMINHWVCGGWACVWCAASGAC